MEGELTVNKTQHCKQAIAADDAESLTRKEADGRVGKNKLKYSLHEIKLMTMLFGEIQPCIVEEWDKFEWNTMIWYQIIVGVKLDVCINHKCNLIANQCPQPRSPSKPKHYNRLAKEQSLPKILTESSNTGPHSRRKGR